MNNPMKYKLESVGSPAYQTPVFQGTKSECKNWVNEIVK